MMYRTVAQLDSVTNILSAFFPAIFHREQLPETSIQGRPVWALRMRAGGGGGSRRAVLLVGGTHARELMNPDAIADLAIDLVLSYLNETNITYGGRTWAASEIKLILESLDIWMVFCANPDGREYVMTVDDLWRKNRRDNPGVVCPNAVDPDGVDLNRNADFVWGVTQGQTSCNPCSDVYVGASAFSEPETRNIRSLLNTHAIDTFADVHSFSELILFPWGHAPTQTTDPSKRFTTLPTGTCSTIGVPGYQEYMPPRDLQRFQTVGNQIRSDINAVRGRLYTNQASIGLYPTTGTQSDYVYSRHIANPALHKTYGYTFETGPSTPDLRESFHPADPTLIKRDAKSAMLSLIQQSVCAIELIGIQFLAGTNAVTSARRVRDESLASTPAGREWIALAESILSEVGLALLEDRELSREAAGLLEIATKHLQDERTPLTRDEVARAQELIKRVASKSESRQLQSDLQTVSGALARIEGLTITDALETLTRQGPVGYSNEQGA